MSEPTTRCTRCRAEFTDEQVRGVSACPECGTRGVPMRIADDVEIRINWHELRCLTIWATNWAQGAHFERHTREALAAILHALSVQHPDKAPLTLAGDVADLRRAAAAGDLPVDPDSVQTNIRDILDDDTEAA